LEAFLLALVVDKCVGMTQRVAMSLKIEQLTVIGNELAIAWADGEESYISLEALRKACPCAHCQGEPDATGKLIRPIVQLSLESFILRKYELVGGYAFKPQWADGHNTGLYSYDLLKKLGEAA